MQPEKVLDETRKYIQKEKVLKATRDKLEAELNVTQRNLDTLLAEIRESHGVDTLEALNELIDETCTKLQSLIGAVI